MKTEPGDSWSRAASTEPDHRRSPVIKQSDSPPLPPIKTSDSPPPSSKMSDKQNSSSDKTDWNSLLKHSSALGILKPGIVFNSSYGSSSTSSSSSRFPSSYTSSTTGGSSSSIWSSSHVSNTDDHHERRC